MPLEQKSNAFIVRIWLEQREIAGAREKWRGSIQHVESGTTKYFTVLDEIGIFIQPYIDASRRKTDKWPD